MAANQIKLENGSIINADDWKEVQEILAEKGRCNKEQPKVTEIRSKDGVTIKVGNLELKKKPKIPLAKPNYIESKYKGWTIRVWKEEADKAYCCNYYKGEDVRYFDLRYDEVKDENAVFKMTQNGIDEIIAYEQAVANPA